MKAGVPCVPGYHGIDQDLSHLLREAEKIKYPIMIKAVLGGGGKGMKIAHSKEEFKEKLFSSKRESKKAFGDDRILLERYIKNPRHIEVQIFGDHFGNVIYLWERDCSLQRRHQKIIEEAPAPLISADLRKKLGEMAVEAGKAVKYVGAGTVEFIVDCDTNETFFMEMNTRLQVEHPVTEMITNQDLVFWQLHIASGNPLPLLQEDIPFNNHSMEARIYAEDTDNNFLPNSGKILVFDLPTQNEDIRIDTGIKIGDTITLNYDPLIAKVIVRGVDRMMAIRRLDKTLENFLIYGVKTNISFLRKVLNNPLFIKGAISTSFIEDNRNILFKEREEMYLEESVIVPIIYILLMEKGGNSEWDKNDIFSTTKMERGVSLFFEGKMLIWKVKYSGNNRYFKVNDVDVIVTNIKRQNQSTLTIDLISNGRSFSYVKVFEESGKFTIFFKDKAKTFKTEHNAKSNTEDGGEDKTLTTIHSPMPSKIIQIPPKEGDEVLKGNVLIILEAMKMESVILAPYDIIVKKIFFKEKEIVAEGDVLIEFDKK